MAADEVVEVENWVQERVLGSGGFGTVTLWRDKTTSDLIALKKCRTGTDVLLTPKHKERWAKEVEIMKRLNHPNVVKSVEVPSDLAGLRSELPIMCMEFCSKGDLRQVLNKSENCCGLQENDVRALISDVKSAVQYLHSMKITHRDLKPENIVLQETDNKIVYKLIDLGYAKELDQSSICTSFVGTLQYLAPELFMNKIYTCSVDYWSLGLVSHEVITGVRPFLPNMSPAAWMTHVKDKSSDHICAYQDLDGSVIFSSELCHQNHISSTLKYHLERWLKLLLEWNPEKRGRAPGKNNIVVFDLIEEILNKKVITVFCVPAFKYLSYEIDDSTAMTTLQRWIERDTDLSVASQELMLPNGQPVDMEKEAYQCLILPHKQNGAMLYVYKQGSLKVEHDAPRVPPFVAKMLEEPKGLMEYIHQKRTWAHAVFFLQQELQLFTALLLAYKIKLHNLTINGTKLNQQAHRVISQLHEAEARFSLSSDSLAFDEQYAKKYVCFSTKITFWKKVNSGMTMKMNKLKLLVKQLEAKCGSVQRKTLELQRNSHLNAASYDALISYVESGLKCYENLRRRPKEIRQRKTNNLEMARIVYHCLKERYIFLKDEPSIAYLSQLLGVQAEMKQLWSPLSKTQLEINKAIVEIKQTQLERQHSIWTEIAPPEQCNGILPANCGKSPVFTVPSLVAPSIIDPEFPLSSSPAPSNRHVSPEPSQSTPVDDSQQQSLMDSICGVPNANVDTSIMISHNKHLRYMTQDLLTESFQQHVKLLEEGTSLDWTFLNAQEDQ